MIFKKLQNETGKVAEMQCSVDELKELMQDNQIDKLFKAVELTADEQKVVDKAIQQKILLEKGLAEAKKHYGDNATKSDVLPYGRTYLV